MKSPFFIIPLAILVGLALIVGGISRAWSKQDGGETAQGQGILRSTTQPTTQPTATGTPSPIPTPDYRQVWPAQTQAAAAYELAQAQERLARAAATLARTTEQAYQASLLVGTPTAIARATAEAEQTRQADAERQAAFVQQETAKILAAIEREKNAERNRANLQFAALLIGGVVAGAAAIAIIFSVAYRAQVAVWRQSAIAAMEEPLEHISAVSDAPSEFINVGEATSHPIRVPIPPDAFSVWARRMLENETAGINKWETGDSPFSRNAESGKPAYIPFLEWATERGYIAESGGAKILSERGRIFCEGWLRRHGHPPPAADAPETAENGMNHAMT